MKITILSNDSSFARMLMLEIKMLNRGHEIEINGNNAPKNDEERIIVLDLDSPYANGVYENSTIIGFSRHEGSIDTATLQKCTRFFHRPFLISEFLRQIESLARNENISVKEEAPIAAGVKNSKDRLCFLRDNIVVLDGKRIHLSDNEYAILKKLYENKGAPISREMLLSEISSSEGNICDVYICKLRAKLEGDGSEKFIYTVRSKGYMLKI